MQRWIRRLFVFARRKGHIALLLAVLSVALGVRFRNIHRSLPYCGGVDEKTWIEIAWRMLRDGDLNPHRFTKPSLPVYLMLAGSSVGFVSAAAHDEVREAKDLGKKAYPFYSVPRAVEAPKRLFASLSVLALAFLGLVARVLTRNDAALWLAPLFGLLSASYTGLSWTYMNVDIVGAFFAWATIYQLVSWYRRESAPAPQPPNLALDPAIAGALAGATIGCKYNLGLILLPCLLMFLLLDGPRPLARACLLIGTCAAVFVLVTPYALLDYSHFVGDVAREARHYGIGHRGVAVDAGWPMFVAYARGFLEDWGPWLLVGSAVGHLRLARREWRPFVIVSSFPVALVALMAMQRVYFFRNVVAVQLWVALGLCLACLELPRLLRATSARFPALSRRPWLRRGVAGAGVVILLLALPWATLRRAYASEVSSRHAATRWILRELAERETLLVDQRLYMDTSGLATKHEVVPLDGGSTKHTGKASRVRAQHGAAVAILPESSERYYVSLQEGATRLASFGTQPILPGKNAYNLDPKLVIMRLAAAPE
jgi:hypothetical protein